MILMPFIYQSPKPNQTESFTHFAPIESYAMQTEYWLDCSCDYCKPKETEPTRKQILDDKSRKRDRELWRVRR